MSQASADYELRANLRLQLDKWREYRVDPHVARPHLKIYEILSGNVNTSAGTKGQSSVDTSTEINISEGLDWKRAFGIRFWFGQFDASISDALHDYLGDCDKASGLAKPAPDHMISDEASEARRWDLPDSGETHDALYEIVYLFTNTSTSLEAALSPRAFTSSPYDYRRSWHLYQLLAKVMQIRDFEDADTEGYSAKAEMMIQSYADYLERLGLWQWALYVYLHMALSERCVSHLKVIC